jgi:hypothetical protein
MFRFTKKPSSGSHRQYLAKITCLVQRGYRRRTDIVSVFLPTIVSIFLPACQIWVIPWRCPYWVGRTDCCIGSNFVSKLPPKGAVYLGLGYIC